MRIFETLWKLFDAGIGWDVYEIELEEGDLD